MTEQSKHTILVQTAAEWARSNAHKYITSKWEGDYIDWHAIAEGMITAAGAAKAEGGSP